MLCAKCKAYMGIGQAILLFAGTSSATGPHIEAFPCVNNGDCSMESKSKVYVLWNEGRGGMKAGVE